MEKSYFILICVLAIVPFALGIVFMIIYYTKFHPNIMVRREIDGVPSESSEVINDLKWVTFIKSVSLLHNFYFYT